MGNEFTPPKEYSSWSLEKRNEWMADAAARYQKIRKPVPPWEPTPSPDKRTAAEKQRHRAEALREIKRWRYVPRSEWIYTEPIPPLTWKPEGEV